MHITLVNHCKSIMEGVLCNEETEEQRHEAVHGHVMYGGTERGLFDIRVYVKKDA